MGQESDLKYRLPLPTNHDIILFSMVVTHITCSIWVCQIRNYSTILVLLLLHNHQEFPDRQKLQSPSIY